MGWQSSVGLNVVIATAYFGIAAIIVRGLVRTGQLRSNRLAVATAAIFLSCGLHHGHHAAHVAFAFGHSPEELEAIRHAFGEFHSVMVDVFGGIAAVVYLGLRRSYSALLHTPAMFDDAVRLETERRLRALAFVDQMTGLDNRAAYQVYADALALTDQTVAVLFVDVDGFKGVNDSYGHDAGDRLLRQMADRMAQGTPPGIRLFRLGGDEFVVVAPGHGQQEACALASRYRELIATPASLREGPIVLPASVGVAVGPAAGIDRLVRDADMAMYFAKQKQTGLAVFEHLPAQATAPVSPA